MCFSATASFSAAVLTDGVGIAALVHVRRVRDIPLASLPIVFGTQQAIEGGLWLGLRNHPGDPANQMLALAFTAIALVVWPIFAPLGVGLSERNATVRRLIYVLLSIGVVLAGYSGISLLHHPYVPSIVNASICYINGVPYPMVAMAAYMACTCLPPLISTDQFVRAAGIAIATGLIVSAAFYYEGFISVWCFFAALASVAIFGSFQRRGVLTASI